MKIRRSYINEIKLEKRLARKLKVMQSRHLLMQRKPSTSNNQDCSLSDMAWTFCMLFVNSMPLIPSSNCK